MCSAVRQGVTREDSEATCIKQKLTVLIDISAIDVAKSSSGAFSGLRSIMRSPIILDVVFTSGDARSFTTVGVLCTFVRMFTETRMQRT
jgi:hypothetical protein